MSFPFDRRMLLAAVVLSVSGCANLNSIYRSATVRSATPSVAHLTLIDAKQRAILSGTRAGTLADGTPVGAFKTFCAEPSPDTFSAYAAALSGSGVMQPSATSAEAIKVLASAAFGEQAGSIGLRTQSITILRDSMFRVCESYLNRALNEHQVDVLHRRFQSVMVALLSIEQLTGPMVAAQATLTSSAHAGSRGDPVEQAKMLQTAYGDLDTRKGAVATAQTQLDSANAALKQANDDLAAFKAGNSDAKKIEEKKTELKLDEKKAEVAAKQQALDAANEAVKQKQEQIAILKGVVPTPEGSVSGGAVFNPPPNTSSARSDVAVIADTIAKIVETTSTNNFISDECMAFYSASRTQAPGFPEALDGNLEKICGRLLKQLGSYYDDQNKELKARIDRVKAQTAAMTERVNMTTKITNDAISTDCGKDSVCQTRRFELLQKIIALQDRELDIVKHTASDGSIDEDSKGGAQGDGSNPRPVAAHAPAAVPAPTVVRPKAADL